MGHQRTRYSECDNVWLGILLHEYTSYLILCVPVIIAIHNAETSFLAPVGSENLKQKQSHDIRKVSTQMYNCHFQFHHLCVIFLPNLHPHIATSKHCHRLLLSFSQHPVQIASKEDIVVANPHAQGDIVYPSILLDSPAAGSEPSTPPHQSASPPQVSQNKHTHV